MSRYIDADKILSSIGLSYKAACEREDTAILEEYKARANAEAIAYLECYLRIKEMLIADVQEVKHGKWIKENPLTDTLSCSICNYNIIDEELATLYCPWCGAKMDLGRSKG